MHKCFHLLILVKTFQVQKKKEKYEYSNDQSNQSTSDLRFSERISLNISNKKQKIHPSKLILLI